MVLLRDGSHRVKDLWLSPEVSNKYQTINATLQPLSALEQLPLANGLVSFYETLGPRQGYVKGSHKFRERLLMSWWTLDWRIGEDKKLGRDKEDGTQFYTSLNPWARDASDMRDFARFLEYWQWNL